MVKSRVKIVLVIRILMAIKCHPNHASHILWAVVATVIIVTVAAYRRY